MDHPAHTATIEQSSPRRRAPVRTVALLAAIVLLAIGSRVSPGIDGDWLNVVPALAALYLCACVAATSRMCGHIEWVRRRLSAAPGDRIRGRWLLSPWLRSSLLMLLIGVSGEYVLRTQSLHRTMLYERQGELPFTPSASQTYLEKISLTRSTTDALGLRGPAAPDDPGRRVVLCLGDSITYGYGVADADTYPARLQRELERRTPGRFRVLNGGVNAYPISFEHQKFLRLWDQGVRPDVAIVGYSMNEGWLGSLVDSDAKTKDQFETRVKLKNFMRGIALYNLVIENWARRYYDAVKPLLVPGTHSLDPAASVDDHSYEAALDAFTADLRARGVRPLFVLFATFDGRVGRYDTAGPYQQRFAAFAEAHHLELLRSSDALATGRDADLSAFYIDDGHMSPAGNAQVAASLADLVAAEAGGAGMTAVASAEARR